MTKSLTTRTPWRRPRSASSSDSYPTNGKGNRPADLTGRDADSTGASTTDTPADLGDWRSITDSSGYLLRRRIGSDVPVGPRAAASLSKGFTDREIAILIAVEQLGMASVEQLARAFFNTHRSAYESLLVLAKKRFLVNVGVDPLIIRRSVAHRPPPRNPVYALDWNGAYLLSYHYNYALPNWRADTVAMITARVGHELGISEVWSYMLAAARATQEANETSKMYSEPSASHGFADLPVNKSNEPLIGMRSGLSLYMLSLALRNERAALIMRGKAQSVHRDTAVKPFLRDKRSVLLKPDAAFIFEITWPNMPNSFSQPQSGDVRENATLSISSLEETETGAMLVRSGTGRFGKTSNTESLRSPRWSPALGSWRPSFMVYPPSTEVMLASEKSDPGVQNPTSCRALLLEMETGANNLTDTLQKIKAYNRLIRTNKEMWMSAYGNSPRVLVVVPTDGQIEVEARKWRLHYFYKQETAVLLTSLQSLARAYGNVAGMETCMAVRHESAGSQQRHAFIAKPCWLDVMVNRWKSLDEAIGLMPTTTVSEFISANS